MIRMNVNLVRGIKKNLKHKTISNESFRSEIKPFVNAQRRRYNKSFHKSMTTLQKRRYTNKKSNEELTDEEFISTLPPELQEIHDIPTYVWISGAISALIAGIAIPWRSIIDHIFYPDDDDDDDD